MSLCCAEHANILSSSLRLPPLSPPARADSAFVRSVALHEPFFVERLRASAPAPTDSDSSSVDGHPDASPSSRAAGSGAGIAHPTASSLASLAAAPLTPAGCSPPVRSVTPPRTGTSPSREETSALRPPQVAASRDFVATARGASAPLGPAPARPRPQSGPGRPPAPTPVSAAARDSMAAFRELAASSAAGTSSPVACQLQAAVLTPTRLQPTLRFCVSASARASTAPASPLPPTAVVSTRGCPLTPAIVTPGRRPPSGSYCAPSSRARTIDAIAATPAGLRGLVGGRGATTPSGFTPPTITRTLTTTPTTAASSTSSARTPDLCGDVGALLADLDRMQARLSRREARVGEGHRWAERTRDDAVRACVEGETALIPALGEGSMGGATEAEGPSGSDGIDGGDGAEASDEPPPPSGGDGRGEGGGLHRSTSSFSAATTASSSSLPPPTEVSATRRTPKPERRGPGAPALALSRLVRASGGVGGGSAHDDDPSARLTARLRAELEAIACEEHMEATERAHGSGRHEAMPMASVPAPPPPGGTAATDTREGGAGSPRVRVGWTTERGSSDRDDGRCDGTRSGGTNGEATSGGCDDGADDGGSGSVSGSHEGDAAEGGGGVADFASEKAEQRQS